MASNEFVPQAYAVSVAEYKKYFDENNFSKDNYQIALFINFLTKKEKLIREIGELTGLKKSQIHCYKKIIKLGKINELKTTPFRKVLKSCTPEKGNNSQPQVEDDIVQQIEKLNISDEIVEPEIHPRAHYFNDTEYSPGKSSFRKKNYCPGGVDIAVGNYMPGQRQVHIPDRDVSVFTFYRLREIIEHTDQVNYLRNKISELEAKLEASEEENRKLKEEISSY